MTDQSDARELAREKIAEIVARFRQTPKSQREAYNEDQTRHYFILPLFRALGWNTDEPAEFSAEEQISRGFVDFGFYLNGVPAFYLETKRVTEKLDKRDNMRQSINYAYLKGVTWAVLTDFERLMVFNADWEEADPIKTRFLDLHYEQYPNGGFDDLWLLSKAALATSPRDIDTKAERYGKKAKKEPVTKALFASLTEWRRALFNDIRQMQSTLWANDSARVDNAVQRFFDRLIFIRTVEDRGVEENRLKALLRQSSNQQLYRNLIALFQEMDTVYNSNLFAMHDLDMMEVHDVGLLKEILNGLYKAGYIEYNFNAITADVLGAVYEQYLGFKATDPDAQTDRKSTKRKAQGIYYTPQYVVRYIVQQTVGKLLADGANPDDLRILDPACGSGSFLIEAFDVLDRHYTRQHPNATPEQRGAWRERILTHNLYGVDLDEQAVEVTRLNLLLRAALKRGKLPLLTNIKHGNSLIEDDAIAGAKLGFKWAERFPEVLEAGGFDAVIGNPPYVRQETLGAAFKEYVQHHYETYAGTSDLYVYFIEKGINLLRTGGYYSVIVANKWLRAAYGQPLRRWLKQQAIREIVDFGDLPVFADATTYPCIVTVQKKLSAGADTFTATRVDTLDFLSLDDYLNTPARRYVVRRAALDDAGWSLADERAAALLAKLLAGGIPLKDYVDGKIYYGIKTGLNEAFVIDEAARKALLARDPRSAELLKPFLAGRDVKRYETPVSEKYLILIPNGWTRANYDPPLPAPAPVHGEGERMTVDMAWDWLKGAYPAVAAHLEPFAAAAQRRADQGEYWWELRPCSYYREFETDKIIFPDLSNRGNFTFDTQNLYLTNTSYIISVRDFYLLSILNSTLIDFAYSTVSTSYRGGYMRYIYQYVSQLPIRTINFDNPAEKAQHDRLVGLVERMLKLKADHAAASDALNERRHELAQDIERTDRAIDTLVYQLYGLTDEEIQIVEGAGG